MTVVDNLIMTLENAGKKVRRNTFKKRRGDDKRFTQPNEQHEWLFRK